MKSITLALLAGLALAGPAAAMDVPAEIKVFQFMPKEIKIKVGDTVTWVNQDNIGHTVTSGKPGKKTEAFDSGDLAKGESFSHTFTEQEIHDMYCDKHHGMKAKIIVEK